MGVIVQTVGEVDVTGSVQCMRTGFLTRPVEGEAEHRRPGMDRDRSWGAFDGHR
jgi:hypothetical protein